MMSRGTSSELRSRPSTFLGQVAAVSGPTIRVQLAQNVSSGMVIIGGTTYRVGLVGSFVRIPQGYQQLYGIVSESGANVVPEEVQAEPDETGRWLTIQLVGESIERTFERGISQYPAIGDEVHIVVDRDLELIYSLHGPWQVPIGRLASAESLTVRVDLDALVTRHCALLGSTGSGKSTTVASLLRSITTAEGGETRFPSARILLLDVHGEYGKALRDVAKVLRVNPHNGQEPLRVPFWAIDAPELITFLTGGVNEIQERHFLDKIAELKLKSLRKHNFPGVDEASLTVDTPIPFSLHRLWYELIDKELATFEGPNRDQPCREDAGDMMGLVPPTYRPHATGSKGPFLNQEAAGIRRQLDTLRSRMLDQRFAFLLRPGAWEPNADATAQGDLPELLGGWLRCEQPVTVLDLSGVASPVLTRLIGSILRIVYEALFWSSEQSAGGRARPLLIVMEEAHRYLGREEAGPACEIVRRIAKEGRKYGIGAMVVSQRPSEVDETILSQCGTFFVLRLSNPADRARVQGTMPDNLAGLMEMLPALRTGEARIVGEVARLPSRCRVTLPEKRYRPRSSDPRVAKSWGLPLRDEKYQDMAAAWRAQSDRVVAKRVNVERGKVSDDTDEEMVD